MTPPLFLAAVASGVILVGCAGQSLLKEARPLETSRPVAEGRDDRILVTIESVIVRNGAGAWASDAEWDEYLIRVRSLSDEPFELREVAIFDALDHRIETRADRGDLVNGTRETQRRYLESGRLIRDDGSYGWVAAGAGTAGTAFVAASATAGPGMMAGLATAAAAVSVVAGAGLVFAGVGIARLYQNDRVNSEIKRRATALPVRVLNGTETKLDLFFPETPLSGRTQVVYLDARGEHRLDIDTREALRQLQPDEIPALVYSPEPGFPDSARRNGIRRGHVIARLTLDKKGGVQEVNVIQSTPPLVFEDEARRTLRSWTYKEGRHDGRTVEVRLDFQR